MTDGGSNSKRPDSKVCGVCGDKALGYNFNAITCESCKAFFRRNALKTKEFKCPFNDSCKVDVVTRRFCQKCRLKKCIDIGMKKEWIMTDEEKKIKKQKIEENRQKRQSTETTPSPVGGVASPSSDDQQQQQHQQEKTSSSPLLVTKTRSRVIVTTSSGEIPVDVDVLTPTSEERSSSECDGSLTSPSFKEILSPLSSGAEGSPSSLPNSEGLSVSSPCSVIGDWRSSHRLLSPSPRTSTVSSSSSPSSIYGCNRGAVLSLTPPYSSPTSSVDAVSGVLNVVIKSELVSTCLQSPSADSGLIESTVGESSSDLTPTERHKLNELNVANKAMKSPITDDDQFRSSVDPSLINVINLTDLAIRRLIKMSKRITGFRNLCQEDQIALLKGSCTELMILRSVMTYNPENDCWLGPKGPALSVMRIKLDVLREAKGNIYEEHKRFIHSFDTNWRTDENVMLILSAITLFCPNRPNVIHKDLIQKEQDMYYTLLRRYLESLYSACEARSSYLKLVQRIEELHLLNDNHVRVFLDVDPKDVEPLLIEIFDLKNH